MKLVIVGGVAGGASAAARARRVDEHAEIVLFERGEDISFANCGLPYHVGKTIPNRDALLIMTPARFRARTGIDVRVRQEITAIDPAAHTVTVFDRETERVYTESYDKLILSPGASPIRPAIPGVDDPAVTMLWTLADMDRVKARVDDGIRRVVVAGGGFIGLELVEELRRRNLEVTLVEMAPQLLPPFDPEMTTPLAAELAANGVRLLLESPVAALRRAALGDDTQAETVQVVLGDGRTVSADLVVLAIGVRPNATLAQSAGLAAGARGGILVDEKMRTSDPDIYAVGDAVQVTDALGNPAQIPLAGPANRQGRIAADNALGGNATYRGTFGTAVVKLFALTAASTGASEKMLKAAAVPYEKIYLNPFSHATYYPGAQMMHLKLLFSQEGKILGAQIVGRDGVDKRIDVIATAMQAGLGVRDLAALELAYAPPYGSAKDPVNFAGFVAANLLDGKTDVAHADALPEGAYLLDVREPAEHAAGAIPGSTLIPLGTLRGRLGELPRDREIVAYCAVGIRGYLAERILKQEGFKASNLSGGFTTWKLFRAASTRTA
ncbi:MAG TPA: FAD-dependent oxidoreductase [Candidatus Deferrimicrobiaceae bacterium]|jgi:NADPH-dependent 2,4-dienoyl-CoA reductase/sulfur reductase-like enzyme/rhodanese-related sulfurtransferase